MCATNRNKPEAPIVQRVELAAEYFPKFALIITTSRESSHRRRRRGPDHNTIPRRGPSPKMGRHPSRLPVLASLFQLSVVTTYTELTYV